MVDSILCQIRAFARNTGGALRECRHRAAAQERQGGQGLDGGRGEEFFTRN